MNNQRQQGDVTYEKIECLPTGVKPVNRGDRGHILAKGEHTGHAHVIKDGCDLYEKEGVLYLVNEKQVTLEHEEHKPHLIEPGIWEVGIVREHDYTRDMVRNVQD